MLTGWGLYAKAAKNRYKLIERIWDICTSYLGAAILLGADEEYLWDAYARAEGWPFLAGGQGERLSRAWATEQSKRHLGAGIGIVRTLWHDHCAAVGTDRAVTIALAICGQHDPRTTRHYRTEAGKRTRIDQAQDLVEAAAEACMEAAGSELQSVAAEARPGRPGGHAEARGSARRDPGPLIAARGRTPANRARIPFRCDERGSTSRKLHSEP